MPNEVENINCKQLPEVPINADYIHNSSTPEHCCNNDNCECHHPLRLWAIKYEVVGTPKFTGVAVVQAKDLCNAQYVFIQNSKFNGFREYIHILCIDELYPNPEPIILLEDSAALIDRHNLKSYPFLLKSDYEHNIQNISDNVIEAVEDYIEHNPIQQVQSNWNETDETSKAYILNKPTIPDAQVQANWNETDTNSKAYILNKPEIPDAQIQADWSEDNATSKAYIKNKPTIPAEQIQSDWNETNESSKAFIQNKPTIPEAQVNADWESESGKSQILNKPTDLVRTSDIEGLLKNDGSVYTGKYLEQVEDLDNFQASEGKIVQYIGETNSKYTNGYVYKKVGTEIIIPAGTKYININDSTNNLSLVGIPNGTYYQVSKSDEDINITSKIKYHLLIVSSTQYVAVEFNDENTMRVPIIGVWGCKESVFSKVIAYYNDAIVSKQWYAKLENNKYIYSREGRFIDTTFPNVIVLKNAQGVKIYAKYAKSGNIIQVLPLFYNESKDKYNVIAPENTFEYSYYTTSEQIIQSYEWQQLDVQPREDTSHYVTDSEIGWIEH